MVVVATMDVVFGVAAAATLGWGGGSGGVRRVVGVTYGHTVGRAGQAGKGGEGTQQKERKTHKKGTERKESFISIVTMVPSASCRRMMGIPAWHRWWW